MRPHQGGDGGVAGRRPPHGEHREQQAEGHGHRHLQGPDLPEVTCGPQQVGQAQGNGDGSTDDGHAHLPARVARHQLVGQPAADQRTHDGGHTARQTHQDAGVAQVQAVRAHQERRAPDAQPVAGQAEQHACHGDPGEARRAPDLQQHLLERLLGLLRLGLRCRRCVPTPPRGLHASPAQQQRGHDARHRHDDEGRAPAVLVRDPGARPQAEERTQVRAQHVDTHRTRTLRTRVEIGNHGQRGRTAPRLTHGHAHARQRQLRKAHGHAAQPGHHAPAQAAPGDEIASVGAVGIARKRDGQRTVKGREGQAGEEAHGGVGSAELLFHRLDQHPHDLAVDQVHRVDQGQDRQGPVGLGAAGTAGVRRDVHEGPWWRDSGGTRGCQAQWGGKAPAPTQAPVVPMQAQDLQWREMPDQAPLTQV